MNLKDVKRYVSYEWDMVAKGAQFMGGTGGTFTRKFRG